MKGWWEPLKTALLILCLAAIIGWTAQAEFGPGTIAVGSGAAYTAGIQLYTGKSRIYDLTVDYHTAGFRTIILIDGTGGVPGNGALTSCYTGTRATGCVAWCFEGDIQAGGSTETFSTKDFTVHGLPFTFGIIAVASTNTAGCWNLTADGANDAFFAQVEP